MSTYDIIPTISEFCVDQLNGTQDSRVEHYNNIRSRRCVYKRDVIFDPNIIIDLILESKAQHFGFQIHSPNSERAYPIIGKISQNSLADRAGLKTGWKILSVNRTCLYKISSKTLKVLMAKNKKLGYMKMKLFSEDKEYCDLKEPVHLKAPPLKKSNTGSLIKRSFRKLKSSFKHFQKKKPSSVDNNKQIKEIIEPIDPDVDILLRMCDSVKELKQCHYENADNIIYYLTPLLSQLNDSLRHSTDPMYDAALVGDSSDILADDDIYNVFNFYDKMLKTAFVEEKPLNDSTTEHSNHYSALNVTNNECANNETCVTVSKTNTDEIGVTILKENQSIVISRILKNSLAEKTGQLKVGDEIIEINKIPIKGLSIEDVLNVLNQEKKHGLTFLIKTQASLDKNTSFCVDTGNSIKNESKYVKALFNYSVNDDEQARCKEIGISFSIGDILEIVDRSDLFYWQAKKVKKNNENYTSDDNSKIGLIPSRNYYQNVLKNVLNNTNTNDVTPDDDIMNCLSCFHNNNKAAMTSSTSDDNGIDKYECGYQDIILISPDPFNCRPIFVISSNLEELDALVDVVIDKIPHICQRPTFYTTKPNTNIKKYPATEVINKNSFERAINHNQFIGITQNNNHYYGYSIKDIWRISQQGKICLIPTDDSNVGRLYKSGLRPYLVLLKLNDPRNHHRNFRAVKKISSHENSMFHQLQPFVDDVIVHVDVNETIQMLENIILKTLNSSLWVPVISEIYQK